MRSVDTNVLVRFLTHDDPEQTPRAVAFFEERTSDDPAFVSLVVLAELYWVLTAAYDFDPRAVVEQIENLSGSDEIVTEQPAVVHAAIAATKRGAGFADALIHGIAARSGCTDTVTFDGRAARHLGLALL